MRGGRLYIQLNPLCLPMCLPMCTQTAVFASLIIQFYILIVVKGATLMLIKWQVICWLSNSCMRWAIRKCCQLCYFNDNIVSVDLQDKISYYPILHSPPKVNAKGHEICRKHWHAKKLKFKIVALLLLLCACPIWPWLLKSARLPTKLPYAGSIRPILGSLESLAEGREILHRVYRKVSHG